MNTRLLNIIQEIRSNLLLGRLNRITFHIIIIDTLAKIQFKVRMHILLGVLSETQTTLRHAIIQKCVGLLLTLDYLMVQVCCRRLLQKVGCINILTE